MPYFISFSVIYWSKSAQAVWVTDKRSTWHFFSMKTMISACVLDRCIYTGQKSVLRDYMGISSWLESKIPNSPLGLLAGVFITQFYVSPSSYESHWEYSWSTGQVYLCQTLLPSYNNEFRPLETNFISPEISCWRLYRKSAMDLECIELLALTIYCCSIVE